MPIISAILEEEDHGSRPVQLKSQGDSISTNKPRDCGDANNPSYPGGIGRESQIKVCPRQKSETLSEKKKKPKA
jgi:hypothetical protein